MKNILLRTGLIVLLFVEFACADEKKTLPRGYKLLCSPEGRYTLYLPREKRNSVNTWEDKEAAIRYAWTWEKQNEERSENYKWSECK